MHGKHQEPRTVDTKDSDLILGFRANSEIHTDVMASIRFQKRTDVCVGERATEEL